MNSERAIIRGYTIFCDDIRQEIGGKLSFMGVYNAVLIPSAPFPVTLAKLCAAVSIRFYTDEPLPSKAQLKVFIPGQDAPSLVADLPLPDQPIPALVQQSETLGNFWSLNLNIVIAPLEIKEEGILRIRAFIDGDEWKVGALRIGRHGESA